MATENMEHIQGAPLWGEAGCLPPLPPPSSRVDVVVKSREEAEAAGLLREQTRPLDWWHRPKATLASALAAWLPDSRQLDQAAELDCFGRLIAELLTHPGVWLTYARRHEAFKLWSGYVPETVTCNRVVRLVDSLRDRGLVEHRAGYRKKDGGGWQSSLRALPAFHALFTAEQRLQTEPDPAAPVVIVKDEQGNPCEPASPAALEAACRKVGLLREWMRSFVVEAPVSAGRKELTQMFSSAQLDKHGRYYGWWQNLKKEERLAIKLDGEPVCELDYGTNHPSILYNSLGLSVPENTYTVDGVERELAKTTFGRMINSRNKEGTVRTLAYEQGSRERAEHIVNSLLAIHAPLVKARKFWSGVGLELMHRDSQVAVLVMQWARLRRIPMLPVHDSFVVPARYADDVKRQMELSYHAHMGVMPQVKYSGPTS